MNTNMAPPPLVWRLMGLDRSNNVRTMREAYSGVHVTTPSRSTSS
jgi:hypothetical protein